MMRGTRRAMLACGAMVALVAGLTQGAAPAAADSFSFSYSSGGARHLYHRPYWRHHGQFHHHHYHRHPRVAFSYVYAPPRVIYAPPPAVVYIPPPIVPSAAPIGVVPASPVYQTADGRYCREYQSSVVVGNTVQPSYGTACLMPDGAWRIVN